MSIGLQSRSCNFIPGTQTETAGFGVPRDWLQIPALLFRFSTILNRSPMLLGSWFSQLQSGASAIYLEKSLEGWKEINVCGKQLAHSRHSIKFIVAPLLLTPGKRKNINKRFEKKKKRKEGNKGKEKSCSPSHTPSRFIVIPPSFPKLTAYVLHPHTLVPVLRKCLKISSPVLSEWFIDARRRLGVGWGGRGCLCCQVPPNVFSSIRLGLWSAAPYPRRQSNISQCPS